MNTSTQSPLDFLYEKLSQPERNHAEIKKK